MPDYQNVIASIKQAFKQYPETKPLIKYYIHTQEIEDVEYYETNSQDPQAQLDFGTVS